MPHVTGESQAVSDGSLPSGTVTFLFTDIEGSTKLAQQYSDEMPLLLARHHDILNQAIAAHNGFTFQIVGDSFAVAFHNATDALNAALDSQRALYGEVWSPAPIKVRMGIHTGTARLEEPGNSPRYTGYATIAQSQRIMSAGHGGQVLLSQTSADLVGSNLPTGIHLIDMRERRLKDIVQPVHLYQVGAPDLPSDFPPLATAEQAKHNLPSELTPFIGREMELTALKTLLGDSSRTQFANRLVTIVAQGGMGKTRLGLQVAAQMLPAFPQGLYFVELDRIKSPDLIVQAVAQVLPIVLASNEDPKTRVLDYLSDKAILLVMDNFEHVLDGAALLPEILSAAPHVQILATSRVRLNLTSETVFNIGGLTIGAAAIEQNSALQLFAQSARRARPQFELNAANLPAVTHICRLVEGMPLAIVLAAAWINTLTVKEISDEIVKSIDMLETEQRDMPDRQRSVRAVIESSWNLIDATAQGQMKRLSVFRGGFTRAAAQDVAGASLRSLAQLVDKALLRRDPETGRYSMHELLRQYAQEQLERSAEEERAANEKYAQYFAEFMKARWAELCGTGQPAALLEIDADLSNIRIAWNYWGNQQNASQLLKFIDPLWMYFEVRTSPVPAIQLYNEVAQKLTSSELDVVCARAEIRTRQGWFYASIGQPAQGLAMAQEGISILREHNRVVSSLALQSICNNAIWLNKMEEFGQAAQEMVTWAEQHGNAFEQSYSSSIWLYTLLFSNQIPRAVQVAERVLDTGERLDNPVILTWMEWELGVCSLTLGDMSSAKAHYLRALAQAERIGFLRLLQIGYEPLTTIALMEHDFSQAEQYALKCLAISQECGQTREMIASLRDLATAYIAQGKLETALELLAVIMNHPASEQNTLTRPERLRDEAEKLRVQVESQLDASQYRAAWAAGERRQLGEVASQLLNQGNPS